VLESHIRFGLKADTGTENVGERGTLLRKSIDNWGAGRSEGSLFILVSLTIEHGSAAMREITFSI
jgi:hypothetical protein